MANPLEVLLPAPPPPGVAFRYATVTGVAPIRVHLDGDTSPLASTPTTLVTVRVGDRVRVMIYHRQAEILGVVGGGDSGWVTATSAAGFNAANLQFRKIGNVVHTRGPIIPTGSGALTNAWTLVAYLPSIARAAGLDLSQMPGGATIPGSQMLYRYDQRPGEGQLHARSMTTGGSPYDTSSQLMPPGFLDLP